LEGAILISKAENLVGCGAGAGVVETRGGLAWAGNMWREGALGRAG